MNKEQPKRKRMSERAAEWMGGEKNDLPDSFIFSLLQLKKIFVAILFFVVFVLTLSSQVVLFKGLPGRVEAVETKQAVLGETQIRQGIETGYIKESLDGLKTDIRFIRQVIERRK